MPGAFASCVLHAKVVSKSLASSLEAPILQEAPVWDAEPWKMGGFAGVERSAVTHNTLMDAYVREGWLDAAKKEGRRAMDAGHVLDVWAHNTLIKGSLQEGDLKGAHEILHQMQRLNVKPNVVSLCPSDRPVFDTDTSCAATVDSTFGPVLAGSQSHDLRTFMQHVKCECGRGQRQA